MKDSEALAAIPAVGDAADRPMTLDEAIAHAEDVAGACDTACRREHKQLADWLKELRDMKRKCAISKDSSAVGDAAALREALTYARDILAKWQIDTPLNAWGEIKEARRRADAALAKPPRQCDVGTAEEQYSRMLRKCYEWMCIDCKQSDKDFRKCAISWAQMPYKEGESDGSK